MKSNHLLAIAMMLTVAACGGDTSSTTAVPAEAPLTITTSTTSATLATTAAPTTTVAPPTSTTVAPTTTATTTTTTTVAPTSTTTTTTTTTTAPPATTTTAIDYVAWGAELVGDLGCVNCHSINGADGLGPTWTGLAGSTVPLSDGSTVTATAGYIEESIRFPDTKIVEGFSAGLMQSSYNTLSEGEIAALVAYVASR